MAISIGISGHYGCASALYVFKRFESFFTINETQCREIPVVPKDIFITPHEAL